MAKLVNWHDFNKIIREKRIKLFASAEVRRLFGSSKVAADFLLYRYAKKGFIVRIKRGLYALPDALPPEPFIANKLYEPSYVSLEFALSYHGVIPESVYEITSVTPKATRRFTALDKIYSYRRIKKAAFTGYAAQKQGGAGFFIADPEKAFVDSCYFRVLDGIEPLNRFKKDKINIKKAARYARLFANAALDETIKKILR